MTPRARVAMAWLALLLAVSDARAQSPLFTTTWVAFEVSSDTAGGQVGQFASFLFTRNDAGEITGASWDPLRARIDAAYAAGHRVVLIHRPWGETNDVSGRFGPKQPMANDARYLLASHDLVRQWDAFQRRLLRDYADLHLVLYVGSLRSPTLVNRRVEGETAAWLLTARNSILPALDAPRVHLCFDNASSLTAEMSEWKWIVLVQALFAERGKHVFLEAIAKADSVHQHDYPTLATENFWQSQVVRGGSPRHVNPGRTVRFLDRNSRFNQKLWVNDTAGFIQSCWDNKTVPCVDWSLLSKE